MPRFSLALRTAGERTFDVAQRLVGQQSHDGIVSVISQPSVQSAFLASLHFHVEQSLALAVNLDADVLLRPNGLQRAIQQFEKAPERPEIGYFRMLCKLHGGFAFVGLNIFRREVLPELLDVARSMPSTLRPDADAIQVLRERKCAVRLFNFPVGLHDYEQYLGHIYVKMFNRARRSRSVTLLAERFEARAPDEDDFRVALLGIKDGLRLGNRDRLVWLQDFPDLQVRLASMGLRERDSIFTSISPERIEQLLLNFSPAERDVSWRAIDDGVELSYGGRPVEVLH